MVGSPTAVDPPSHAVGIHGPRLVVKLAVGAVCHARQHSQPRRLADIGTTEARHRYRPRADSVSDGSWSEPSAALATLSSGVGAALSRTPCLAGAIVVVTGRTDGVGVVPES
jgi:hypothetical protein